MQTGHEMQESIVLACRILHELQNRDIQLADLMRVLEEDTAPGAGGGRREERPQRSAELSSPEEAEAWSAESGRYAGELPEVAAKDVWDDDYVGVWHLGEASLPMKESSRTSTDFSTSSGSGGMLAMTRLRSRSMVPPSWLGLW